MRRYLCLLLPLSLLLTQISCITREFTSDTYPNPKTVKGAKECNMRSVSNVCDPDQVLSESARYRFNHELQKMIRRTERTEGDFCDRKGFEPLLLIAQEADQELADGLNQKWNLDGQCKKAVIFFLSAIDHGLFYSTEPMTGFDQNDFLALKFGQEQYLAEGNYTFALQNIFKQIGGAKNIQATSEDKEEHYKVKTTAGNASSSTALSFVALLIAFVLVVNPQFL